MTDRGAADPVAITGLIDRVLGRLARADIAPVVRLRMEWNEVAGPWSTKCRPVALRGGVLTVVVVSGLEATRIRYGAGELAARAAAALGDGTVVTRIAVRVATPAEQAAAAAGLEAPATPAPRPGPGPAGEPPGGLG